MNVFDGWKECAIFTEPCLTGSVWNVFRGNVLISNRCRVSVSFKQTWKMMPLISPPLVFLPMLSINVRKLHTDNTTALLVVMDSPPLSLQIVTGDSLIICITERTVAIKHRLSTKLRNIRKINTLRIKAVNNYPHLIHQTLCLILLSFVALSAETMLRH